jgi:hypothetical protein
MGSEARIGKRKLADFRAEYCNYCAVPPRSRGIPWNYCSID